MSERDKNIEKTSTVPTYLPPVDIYEKDKAMVVVADMPGVDEKSVDVNFESGVLSIKGTVESNEPEGLRPLYRECREGNYERSFNVHEQINVENIAAVVKDGVLSVHLPYVPEPEPKKITVKVG